MQVFGLPGHTHARSGDRVPVLRRRPHKCRWNVRRRYAARLPKGLKGTEPGAFVQLDASIETIMLTGNNKHTADAVGRQLGMEVRAELLPQDKQRIVGELKAQGFSVAKIGDGINDAPALAAADVGIAMGGGGELETANAAMLHG